MNSALELATSRAVVRRALGSAVVVGVAMEPDIVQPHREPPACMVRSPSPSLVAGTFPLAAFGASLRCP